MSYRDFTIEKVEALGYTIEERGGVFQFKEMEIPSTIKKRINNVKNNIYDLSTEEARKVFIICPTLEEIVDSLGNPIKIMPEKNFPIDESKDLIGTPDYILGKILIDRVTSPVVLISEAKNENMASGYPQCMAAMVAAQILNERNKINKTVYGVVSTGEKWGFLRLDEKHFLLERVHLTFSEQDTGFIMGTIAEMITDFFKK